MATTGRTSDYDDELLGPPADDDLIDVSVLVSTGPDVWVSTKMRYAVIKGASSSIPENVIAIGNAAGDGIEDSNGAIVDYGGSDLYFTHVDDIADGNGYMIFRGGGGGGNTWLNSPASSSLQFAVGGSVKMVIRDGVGAGVSVGSQTVGDTFAVGLLTTDTGAGARTHIKGLGDTSATDGLTVSSFSGDDNHSFQVRDDGKVFLLNGDGVNEFSTDGTLAGDSDDAVPTEKAVKTYVDAQSGGGWLGSETRIKIAPWDIVSYNDKDGVSIQDDGGVVNDAAAKITTMVTGVFIPTGYTATGFMINASANIAIELFESQINDSTAVSRGSGNANTEVNITNVNSTITNYLSIIIVEAGNDIQGGYVVIQEI
jgi:hypothetical protein